MVEAIFYTSCFKAILLLFLHIFFCFQPTNVIPTSSKNETDYRALLAFKSKISNDPSGVLKTWNDSLHFCHWRGILCSRRRDRVVSLDLSNSSLVGSLSPHIGNLSFLRELNLPNNQFRGGIPQEIGRLFRLKVLTIYNNSLEGMLPPNLSYCSNLLVLRIGHNKLEGKLPMELASLSKLTYLTLTSNHFKGGIPSFIGNFTSLSVLSAAFNDFGGTIPDALGRLSNLAYLALGANKLTGRIPLYMQNMALQQLDLSFNKLEGEVPSRGVFDNASEISVEGNKRLCGGIPELKLPKCSIKSAKQGKLKNVHIVVIVISIVIIVTASFFMLCLRKRKNKQQPSGLVLKEPLVHLSYQSLLKATDGFSPANLLGIGSFGSVYKGVLEEDGTNVAVKVLDLHHRGASKSFVAECEALKNIRHRNLVKVVTACSSIDFQGNDFKALVYELMPIGSLERWLHSSVQTAEESSQGSIKKLSLLQRIGITIDVASALNYLHHHCEEPIVHCDVKPSNVLLDNDMTAHLGDFGLAKFISEFRATNQSSSIGVRGTIGYAAPEYGMGSEISIHGDLYSFGVLLLEMMTGKSPTDSLFEGGRNLHNYANMAIPDQIEEIIDPSLLQEVEALIVVNRRRGRNINMMDCLVSIIRIGVACSMESPQDRMVTSDVLKELHVIKNNLLRVLFSIIRIGVACSKQLESLQ